MAEVSIRALPKAGGHVLDRVMSSEHVVITRDGQPIAELRQLTPAGLSAEQLLQR
ncbi:hypothetical protein [Aeromicrobium sp.]|uniref:type II toxin-antitoxin system Phd/YefM family antitoxin n=1 Tax=Aeromicrobium sp. TaxID=1871063 RepID=UPI00198FA1A3|nr:hypothetical protein [Aeromicrobium sp.]MBC7630456.1 hypothetical protein [Aeromicrobium sp.]